MFAVICVFSVFHPLFVRPLTTPHVPSLLSLQTLSNMSGHESDQDVAMLESKDILPEEEDRGEEERQKAPSPSMFLLAENTAVEPTIAGSKELRLQQQEENEEEVAVEAVLAEDDDDDDDAVMASVVVDDEDEDDDVPLIALAAPEKRNTTTSSKKQKANKRKTLRISQGRLEAASNARTMLVETVPRLPVLVSDTHVVRSFGRIHVESPGEESKWSSANALYPAGFSCDRYEFSPAHGRVLKMRCTIFDGKNLKEKRRKHGIVSDGITDGPIFRVMWGQGVDEDVDIVDYPYDVYSASAPISGDSTVDSVAVPFSGKDMSEDVVPEEGMRVRVRFEHDVWYSGTVVSVADEQYDKKKRQTIYDIRVHYDDGSVEDTVFPDPDISIYLPGEQRGGRRDVSLVSPIYFI